MKSLLMFASSGLMLFGAMAMLTPATSGLPVSLAIDHASIRAMLRENAVDVLLPIRAAVSDYGAYDVTVGISDLQGKSIGESRMTAELKNPVQTLQLTVNGAVDRARLAAYVIHYTVRKGDAVVAEGKRSLFYAARQIQTHLLMQRQFYANSQAAVRVIVNDPGAKSPISGADVTLTLAQQAVFQGQTDATGTLNAQFAVPAGAMGEQELTVTVKLDDAEDVIRQTVTVKDVFQILLTTDKPLYQPSQVMHIRSLALKKPDLFPAGEQAMTLEVEDSKGNKVFKKAVKTDKFGISAADFQLASEVNEGAYKIRAIFGENTQEKTVTVQRYVLPKFKVALETDKQFYQPGQPMKGTAQVDYFFGKPVAGGTVIVTLSKFDAGFEKFAELKGKTDENGHYEFETTLPDYFVGQPLEQGNAFVSVEVAVTDTAEHEEKKTLNRAIAADALTVVAIPESGAIVPGVENIFYFAASYPDGTPALVSIDISDGQNAPVTIPTDESGIGELPIMAQNQTLALTVTAKDRAGASVTKTFEFTPEQQAEAILLRTDKALYKLGDTIAARVFSTKATGTVYLDLIKDGQTFLTQAVDLRDGQAQVDIVAAASGSLQLHAYRILGTSDIIRDTKLLFVEAADELNIDVNASKTTYLPGEEARLDFHVSNKTGHPVLAALGVSIVDESVFALQEMQPGLEKIYFMLEKEIMTPRYEIHAFTLDQVILDAPMMKANPAQQQAVREKAAQVLLASAEGAVNYDVNVNTFDQKMQSVLPAIQEKIMADFRTIYSAMQAFSNKQKKVLTKKQGLEAVVKAGLLDAAQLTDPWGNPYIITPGGDDFTYHTFRCIGPDETENTADDIFFDSYIEIGREPGFFDWLFGRRRAQDVMVFKGVPMPMAAAPEVMLGAAMDEDMVLEMEQSAANGAEGGEAPVTRIREYFPETLYFNPAILTDEQGNASIALTMADSITTWRLTSMASSLTGALGSGASAIRVFQDFFADIDLPVTLTQNDQVSIPIAIYNYLPGKQDVRLKLAQEGWFELVNDVPEKTLALNSGQVDVVYFTLKVKEIGWHKLTVHAFGSQMSDALARQIEVVPDGEKIELTWNGRLNQDIAQTVTIPQAAIDGASKILVKIYPGILSQIVEGMDAILQMPSGCFEQTSSSTYPNVLVLDYMKQAKLITPEIQMKAESYITTGYQRLLSYEVAGGGFEWFGNPPAHNILTAYGLMEFSDMAQVHEVDPNVISRTQQWLISQQGADGSWTPTQQYLDEVASRFANDVVRNTAYIAWALLSTGYTGEPADRALAFLKNKRAEITDTYTLALIANAFVWRDPAGADAAAVIDTLLKKKQEQDGKIWWKAETPTAMYGDGESANIETTALVALALLKTEKHHDTIGKIITYLIDSKDSYGTWHSTQATILTMKALILSIKNATGKIHADATILVNGKAVDNVVLTPENADVLRQFDLKDQTQKGENQVQIKFAGEGGALYQIVARYYLPWKQRPLEQQPPMTIEVKYDKTQLAQNDLLTAQVTVKNNRAARANMIIVDLGIAPGFEVQSADLAALVENKTISKFNLTGRQIIVYLDHVDQQTPVTFSYALKAKFPVKVKTPKSTVYEYYNPAVKHDAQPQELVVREAAAE